MLFATMGAGLFAEIAETGSASWLYLCTDRQAAEAADAGKPATAVTTNTRGALAGTTRARNRGEPHDVSVTNDTDVPAARSPRIRPGVRRRHRRRERRHHRRLRQPGSGG
ncbi:MAG: hypothetical protein ACLSVD_15700 [Eggerthellaceae bacterium]